MNGRDMALLAAKVWRNRPAVFPPSSPPLYRIQSTARPFELQTRSANLADMYRAIGFKVSEARRE